MHYTSRMEAFHSIRKKHRKEALLFVPNSLTVQNKNKGCLQQPAVDLNLNENFKLKTI